MDTNLKALKDLYISLGGAESDVANLTASSEVIPLISNVAGGGSGGGGAAVPVLHVTENDISGELIDNTFFGENGIPPLIEVAFDQSFYAIPLSEGLVGGEDPEANYHMSDVYPTGESGINYIVKTAEIVRQDAITVTIKEAQDGGGWIQTTHFYYSYEPSEGVYKYESQ